VLELQRLMPGRATAVGVLLSLLSSSAVLAGRTEYLVEHDGARLPAAEVCFFQLAPAGADPRSFWFFSNDVRCLPADDLLEIPAGRFHFFAVTPRYVSATRHMLSNPGGQAAEALRRVVVPVTPSASLDLSKVPLRSGQSLAVLVASTADEPGALLPARDRETRLAVPADRPLVAMIIENRAPVAIGAVLTLRAGEERLAVVTPPPAGLGNVVAWISLQPLSASRLEPVETHLVTGSGERFAPLFPIGAPSSANGALQLYRNVPAGRISVLLDGDRWERSEAVGMLTAGQTLVVEEPVVAAPAAIVSGRFALDGAVPPVAAVKQSCASGAEAVPVRFTVYRCPDPGRFDAAACTAVSTRDESLADAVEFSFTRLPIGSYFVEAAHPILGRTRTAVALSAGEQRIITLTSSAFPLFGRITYRKAAVRAEVRFAGGTPAAGAALSSAAGMYEVVLPSDPRDNAVEVAACDGSFEYTFQPAHAPPANAPFDIAVPATVVRLHLTDETSGEPIAGAVAFCTAGEGDAAVRLRSESDQAGIARFTSLPDTTPLALCASAPTKGYVREKCAPVFRLTADEERTVDLSLTRNGVQRGRLVTTIAFDPPILSLVSREGAMRQRVRVGSDGTFWLEQAMQPDDYFVLSGPGAPLFVLSTAAIDDGELVLTVPAVRIRTFLLRAPATENRGRPFALAVAGRHVPAGLLLLHLHNAHVDPNAPWSPSLTVPAIAETGPIAVTLGPPAADAGMLPGTDIFARPELARLYPTLMLPATVDEVTFTSR
jgi:hypothetical protein